MKFNKKLFINLENILKNLKNKIFNKFYMLKKYFIKLDNKIK